MIEFDAKTYKDSKKNFNNEDEQILLDLLRKNNNKNKILDVGCGDGILTSVVKDLFPNSEIVGIDNSKEQIGLTNKKDGVRFEVSDILDFKEEHFDVIYAFYSFPHIQKSKLIEALKSVKILLNTGGEFYLFTNICLFDTTVPTLEEQEACDVTFLDNWNSQINLINLEEIQKLFKIAGFREISNMRLKTGAKIKVYGDMVSWLFILK